MARLAGKRGKLPYNPDMPNIHLTRAHFTALSPPGEEAILPAAPNKLDRLTPCMDSPAGLPMYDNERFGDCVWAMLGHGIQAMTLLNWGNSDEQTVTTDALLQGYHDVTGFDPNDPSSDQGTNIQDALNYWRKVGIRRADRTMDQIVAFAEVDFTDKELMKHAIQIFEVGFVGVNLPQSAEDQFNQGKPWTVVKGSRNLGGHAILDGGYDITPTGMVHLDATWGNTTEIEQDFWEADVEEYWIVITRDQLRRNGGAGPEGFNMDLFAEDFYVLTGQPFPSYVPPAPTPVPKPTPPQGFQDFLSAADTWLSHRHAGINATFARHVETFIKANTTF